MQGVKVDMDSLNEFLLLEIKKLPIEVRLDVCKKITVVLKPLLYGGDRKRANRWASNVLIRIGGQFPLAETKTPPPNTVGYRYALQAIFNGLEDFLEQNKEDKGKN